MGSNKPEIRRWPANASQDYVEARRELLDAELKLNEETERVAALRRNLPKGAPIDKEYIFEEVPTSETLEGRKVSLQELVGNRSLIVYHLMFGENSEEPCSSCAMFVDGLNGVAQHITQHADFVIVGKAPVAKLRAWATKRGWNNARFLSSQASSFNSDMNVENPNWAPDWDQAAGISVFQRDGDVVRHVYSAMPDFVPGRPRGIDLFTPVWNILDIIPEGRGEWEPSNKYIKTIV